MRIAKILALSLVLGLGLAGAADAGQRGGRGSIADRNNTASAGAEAGAIGGRFAGTVAGVATHTTRNSSNAVSLSGAMNDRAAALGIGKAGAYGKETNASSYTSGEVVGGYSRATSYSAASSKSN
jgi:hypothetical protein